MKITFFQTVNRLSLVNESKEMNQKNESQLHSSVVSALSLTTCGGFIRSRPSLKVEARFDIADPRESGRRFAVLAKSNVIRHT